MNHLYLITLIANFLTAVALIYLGLTVDPVWLAYLALITGGAFLGHVLTEVLNDPTL